MKFRGFKNAAIVGILLWLALMMSSCVGYFSGISIKTVEIKAPVEKVFKYLENVNNWFSFPGINGKVTKVEGQGLGQTAMVNYAFGPKQRIDSEFALVNYIPNQLLVFKAGNTGGKNDGAYTFVLSPTPDGGTRLVWISEGSAEVPLFLAITKWGKKKFDEGYMKFMDEFASRLKTELEK